MSEKPAEQPAREAVKEQPVGKPADEEALAGAVRKYDFPVGGNNILATLKGYLAPIQETIKGVIKNRGPQKFCQSITVLFEMDTVMQDCVEVIRKEATFNSYVMTITNVKELTNIKLQTPFLNERVDEWQQNGSNWHVVRVISNFVTLSDYEPLTGCSFAE